MSETLSDRFERALRWYPQAWRNENGAAVIGTLLDVAQSEGRTSPRRSELANLTLMGIGARVDRWVSWRARTLVSSISLGAGVASAAIFFVVHMWSPWTVENGLYVGGIQYVAADPPRTLDAGMVVYALWGGAFVFALCHRRKSARAVLVVTAIIPFAFRGIAALQGAGWYGLMTTTSALFTMLALLSLISRWQLRIVGISAVVTAASLMVLEIGIGFPARSFWSDRTFWHQIASLGNISMVIVAGLIATLILAAYKQRDTAQVVLVFLMPMLVLVFVEVLRGDPVEGFGTPLVVGALALGLGFGIYRTVKSRRAEPTNPEINSALPSSRGMSI